MSFFLELEIPGLPPTVNELFAMKLKMRMRAKRFWKEQVMYATAGKRPAKPLERAKIMLVRHSTTRPDPDGLVSSFKSIIDGLVLSKILANDKFENIGMPTYDHKKAEAGKVKITVTLEEIE